MREPLNSLTVKPVYIECNPVAPEVVRRTGEIVASAGCPYVDAALIGDPPSRTDDRGPRVYVCGDYAGARSAVARLRLGHPRLGFAGRCGIGNQAFLLGVDQRIASPWNGGIRPGRSCGCRRTVSYGTRCRTTAHRRDVGPLPAAPAGESRALGARDGSARRLHGRRARRRTDVQSDGALLPKSWPRISPRVRNRNEEQACRSGPTFRIPRTRMASSTRAAYGRVTSRPAAAPRSCSCTAPAAISRRIRRTSASSGSTFA